MIKFSPERSLSINKVFLVLLLGCLSILNSTNINAQVIVDSVVQDVTCAGRSDGGAELFISDGVGPFTAFWFNTSSTGLIVSGLAAGSHPVRIDDLGDPGSVVFVQVFIGEPEELIAAFVTTSNPTCFNECDGELDLVIQGGTPPYSFSWPAGAVVSADGLSAYGLCSETIAIPIIDANGCNAAAAVALENPDPILLTTNTSINASCAGNDGMAVVQASDGHPPYSYLWSTGETTQQISGLAPGNYSVDVEDITGCNASTNVIINGTTSTLSAELAAYTDISCYGINNGSAQVAVTGGLAPFTYNWSGSNSTQSFATDLAPGTHMVTITDASQCVATLTFLILEPDPIVMTVQVTNGVSCGAVNDGAAMVSASGGIQPYQYQWSSGQTTNIVDDLVVGDYTVVAVDAEGCSSLVGFNITSPPPPGTICDDGDSTTQNDYYDTNCNCVGVPLDCLCRFIAGNGDWHDPSNWSCGIVPTADCDVLIENNRICTVAPGYAAQCKTIYVEAYSELILHETSVLEAFGNDFD